MAEIELTENMLIIHLKGLVKFTASTNRVPLKIPLAHVVGVVIDPDTVDKLVRGEQDDESWSPSFEFPGVLTIEKEKWSTSNWTWRRLGTVPLKGGQEAFSDGGNPKESIMIKLTDESYAMLILKVSDPASTLARIREAVQAYKSS